MTDGDARAHATGQTYQGPTDGALREQWRRERRALVRRHHPDVGGDPEVLQARLAALDHRFGVREDALRAVPDFLPESMHRPWTTARRVLRQVSGAVTSRVPTPRRRRYFDI
jgi:hypothetical protein